jgi:Subtilase family
MSFAVKTDFQRRLSKSISKAANDENGIVVFASTADQGNSEDPYYPAYSNGAIPIACCDEGGEPSQGSDERKAMYLVHGTGFSTQSVDYLQGSTEVKGSSVSNAIAAGVASLVLGCHQLVLGDVGDRRYLIETCFGQMTGGQGRKWLRLD